MSAFVILVLNLTIVYALWLTHQQKDLTYRMQREAIISSALMLTSELVSLSNVFDELIRERLQIITREDLDTWERDLTALSSQIDDIVNELNVNENTNNSPFENELLDSFLILRGLIEERNSEINIINNHSVNLRQISASYALIPGVDSLIDALWVVVNANNLIFIGELTRDVSARFEELDTTPVLTARLRNLAFGPRGIIPTTEEVVVKTVALERGVRNLQKQFSASVTMLRETPNLISGPLSVPISNMSVRIALLALMVTALVGLTALMAWHWSRFLATSRQNQRLESLGTISGEVAHDIQNMVNVTLTSLTILKEKQLKARRKSDPHLEKALFAADKSIAMADRLLAFAKRKRLKPEIVNVNELVEGLYEVVCLTCGEDVIVKLDLDPNLNLIEVDPGQLESSLLNLCINSRNAISTNGYILLQTRNRAKDAMSIEVVDNGCGIPKKDLHKVFEPFYSNNLEQGGQGLGLSMVYGFVHQSGGNIEISSVVGKGTEVKLLFKRWSSIDA